MMVSALEFRRLNLPVWENFPFLWTLICASLHLAEGTLFKTVSFSPMKVDSLEFALAMEVLTSYDHRTVCYGCRRLQDWY